MPTSTITSAETLPSSSSELWALGEFYTANWDERIIVRNSFETGVESSLTGSEQRQGLRAMPLRSMEATLQGFSPEESRSLRSFAMRAAQAKMPVPLFSDVAELATGVSAGASTITVASLAGLRIAAGIRVVIYSMAAVSLTSPPFEVAVVDSISSNTLTLHATLANSFASGSIVLPLMETQVALSQGGTIFTDFHTSMSFKATERGDLTRLPAFARVGTLPPGFSTVTIDSVEYPVMDIPPNFAESISWSTARDGSATKQGIDNIITAYGPRARVGLGVPILCDNRTEAASIISFFESRGGRLHPFVVPNPVTELTLLSIVDNTITVKANGALLDWMFSNYICFQLNDGSYVIRELVSYTRSGAVDTLTLDNSVGVLISAVSRCTNAYLMRFKSDEMVESWSTNSVMSTNLDFVELLDEGTIDVSHMMEITTTALVPVWSPTACATTPGSLCEPVSFVLRMEDGGGYADYDFNFGLAGYIKLVPYAVINPTPPYTPNYYTIVSARAQVIQLSMDWVNGYQHRIRVYVNNSLATPWIDDLHGTPHPVLCEISVGAGDVITYEYQISFDSGTTWTPSTPYQSNGNWWGVVGGDTYDYANDHCDIPVPQFLYGDPTTDISTAHGTGGSMAFNINGAPGVSWTATYSKTWMHGAVTGVTGDSLSLVLDAIGGPDAGTITISYTDVVTSTSKTLTINVTRS